MYTGLLHVPEIDHTKLKRVIMDTIPHTLEDMLLYTTQERIHQFAMDFVIQRKHHELMLERVFVSADAAQHIKTSIDESMRACDVARRIDAILTPLCTKTSQVYHLPMRSKVDHFRFTLQQKSTHNAFVTVNRQTHTRTCHQFVVRHYFADVCFCLLHCCYSCVLCIVCDVQR